MKKFISTLLIVSIFIILSIWWFYNQTSSSPQSINADFSLVSQKQEFHNLEETLNLALKGVNLVQGENGIELWRLKASWAKLSRDGDTIDVDNPIVNYILGDTSKGDTSNNETIQVSANKGIITDKQRAITLWGNVVITQDEKNITGPKMTYNTTKRVIVFPDGVNFYSPIAIGSAKKITWNLDSNVIKATGDIKTILNSKKNIKSK